jgi:hypothetical protein
MSKRGYTIERDRKQMRRPNRPERENHNKGAALKIE